MDISYGNSLEPNACNKSSVIGRIVTNILQFDWTTIRNQIWSIAHQFISYEVRILMRFFFIIICGFVIALLFCLMLSHDVMIVCYLMMLLAVIFFDCEFFFFFRLDCVLLVAFIFCGMILRENWEHFWHFVWDYEFYVEIAWKTL